MTNSLFTRADDDDEDLVDLNEEHESSGQHPSLVIVPPKPQVDSEAISRVRASIKAKSGYRHHPSSPKAGKRTLPSITGTDPAVEEQVLEDLGHIKEQLLFCMGKTASGGRCMKRVVEGFHYCLHHIPNKVIEPKPERLNMPLVVHQPTFEEFKANQHAIADGQTQKHWRQMGESLKLQHVMPGASFRTEFNPTENLLYFLEWLGTNTRVDITFLKNQLHLLDFDAAILFGVCIAIAIERGQYRVGIDDLIHAIGWEYRRRGEHHMMRHKIWQWLLMFDSMMVIGERKRPYWDRDEKKYVSVSIISSLLKITGIVAPNQTSIGMQNAPIEVWLVAGPWLEEHRGDNRIITYFGNLRELAQKKRGQPSQRLAVHIGLALNQIWREHAVEAEIRHAGDNNKQTVKFKPLTRHRIVSFFGGEVQTRFEEMLFGANPKRAKEMWDEAVKLLKDWRIVGFCMPVATAELRRQDSQDQWYRQELLDVRPGDVGTRSIVEIVESARRKKRHAEARKKSIPVGGADKKLSAKTVGV